MTYRFNPPPQWPVPAEGWEPEPGFRPDPSWEDAPLGWQYWVNAADEQKPVARPVMPASGSERAAAGSTGLTGISTTAAPAATTPTPTTVSTRSGVRSWAWALLVFVGLLALVVSALVVLFMLGLL